jgi:hypothetical protein
MARTAGEAVGAKVTKSTAASLLAHEGYQLLFSELNRRSVSHDETIRHEAFEDLIATIRIDAREQGVEFALGAGRVAQ